MLLIYFVALFLFQFVPLKSEQINPDTGFTWSPYNSDIISLETDTGYKIAATVIALNLDGSVGEYVVINSTNDFFDDGLRFTYTVPTNYSFLIGTNIASAQLNIQEENFNGEKEVIIHFVKTGQPPSTTTEASTTDVTFPTPANESRLLTVYLAGNTPSAYADKTLLDTLKNSIVGMAEEYCSLNGIVLKEKITINNVLIEKLTSCPSTWKDSETCAELIFALPIILDEDASSWSGYQLKTQHLRYMWETLANKYLTDCTTYEEPNIETLNVIWYVAISVLVVGFLILLILMRMAIIKVVEMLQLRKYQEQKSRNSSAQIEDKLPNTLEQHYMQETPEFFAEYEDDDDQDDVYAFDNRTFRDEEDA